MKLDASDDLRSTIKPRPLDGSLDDYWKAPGSGPLHAAWENKPHRIVYDLIAALLYYEKEANARPAPVKFPISDLSGSNPIAQTLLAALDLSMSTREMMEFFASKGWPSGDRERSDRITIEAKLVIDGREFPLKPVIDHWMSLQGEVATSMARAMVEEKAEAVVDRLREIERAVERVMDDCEIRRLNED